MKRSFSSRGLVGLLTLLVIVLAATSMVFASEGKFKIKTEDGDTFRFGAQMRFIPTWENNWDFGLGQTPLLAANGLDFKRHLNEAGEVAQSYIRTEARLYFSGQDKDKKWDFYSALEFDSAIDQTEVDQRGRDYGLERLHGSIAIPGAENVRFHAGWDIYYMDAVDAGAGFIYGDDDPGIWFTGDFDNLSFQAGWHKKFENNFAARDQVEYIQDKAGIEADNDRDLLDAMLTWSVNEDNELRFMASLDLMKTRSTSRAVPAVTNKGADVKTYRLGILYKGGVGIVEAEAEFAYQGGKAKEVVTEFGTTPSDQDIKAYAAFADVALNLTDMVGWKLIPHVGFMYTSGDDDANDDNLEGYCAVANAQRFTPSFGGEDTIIGDTNVLLGTILYGYLPEFYGNLGGTQQGGVATGGLANGSIGGRGDNPGMTMIGGGITIEPLEYLSYRTNFMWFEWNEDFAVFNGATNVPVKSGTAGQQWSNSLRFSLSKHVHIFGNATWFWPGEAVKDVTEVYGNRSDKVASRYALALIWRF